MLEQKINEFFGDDEPGGFGTGWWSGVLSAFFGVLGLGAVVCLHFPQLLSSPELRPHYPMPMLRMLIQAVIVAAIVCGVVSAMLRRKKVLALTGMLLALGATLLGGASVEINEPLHDGMAIGLHTLDQLGVSLRRTAKHEERRVRAVLPQQIQQLRRRARIWAVVERQRDDRLARRDVRDGADHEARQ